MSIPDAPDMLPLFNNPIVLDDEETSTNTSIVVMPKPSATEIPVTGTSPHTVARPTNIRQTTPEQPTAAKQLSKPTKHEMLAHLRMLRTDAVVAWANESLKQRDYPESIRRLTIGEPSRNQFSNEQIQLLRQTYADWATALRSENRHTEAQTVLKLAADSPYLGQ